MVFEFSFSFMDCKKESLPAFAVRFLVRI